MKYYKNILETIGNTPLIKLNNIFKDFPCEVFAKVESFNPGNSVKDRMAVKMIEDAEKSGLIKPGGTIVEGTSGNTGMGLALASIVKGYKLICVSNDKQSKEKLDVLRAMGAKVIVCPTDVPADDPKSYYSVSRKIAEETPNSWYVNQYDNLSNSKAHYENTGPEIWSQTEGKITHFVVGVGTGGTISGVGRFLKEKNKSVKIWGIDTYGSVFKKYHETGIFDENEIYPYKTEGIGEDILPKNVDYFLLQKELSMQTKELVDKRSDVEDLSDRLIDFSDTAAACVNMDLIITVDTAVAHLAGALGCPTNVLLHYQSDWRWGLETKMSHWYSQMNLIRLKRNGQWPDIYEEITASIESML